jgi:predicted molibdopterin-dependent oxidoreductase YjgC
MELMLARAPDCEELKKLADKMGVEGTRFPTVTEAQRNCILCGLCVRVCEQVMGTAGIGFAGRGTNRTVAPPFRMPLEECTACRACAIVCPVGTIQVRVHLEEGEVEISPFKSRVKLAKCEQCGEYVISEPLTKEALEKIKKCEKKFSQVIRLCPKCKRKLTADQLAMGKPVPAGVGNTDADMDQH